MGTARKVALAGATALMTTAANAADFPQALPPPVPQYVQAPAVGGWYLRGDVGVGMQNFRSFDHNVTTGVWPTTWRIEQKDIKDTFMVGFGVGYAWNSWLRFDFTGEYRADVKFKAVGSYINFPNPGSPTPRASDFYDGDHRAVVFLANAYLDMGTWWCITPYIGAGVGGAWHTTRALSDIGLNTDGGGLSAWGVAQDSHSNWSFAWALHAGLAYTVTNNFKVDFGYRYLNMGSATTAEILCGATGCGNGSGPRAFYTLRNLDSHDFRIGMRWMLQPEQPVAPPLMRRG
jgi:opacity protein-like surface antigen